MLNTKLSMDDGQKMKQLSNEDIQIINKQMKKKMSIATREVQIQAVLRFHHNLG